jgi:uncharacterized lipoprotein
MHKRIPSLLAAALLASTLGGCVLSSQVIDLNEQSNINRAQSQTPRDALVRVEDLRRVKSSTMLGTRGGQDPQSSPIVASKSLVDTLTVRMQNTMALMGLGVSGPYEPLKVQLDITTFEYKCNEGILVNSCSIEMGFKVSVFDGGKSFSKPFQSKETRSVATAPAASYNQEWANEMLDSMWSRIFSDPSVRQALGVN